MNKNDWSYFTEWTEIVKVYLIDVGIFLYQKLDKLQIFFFALFSMLCMRKQRLSNLQKKKRAYLASEAKRSNTTKVLIINAGTLFQQELDNFDPLLLSLLKLFVYFFKNPIQYTILHQ